MLQKIVVGRLRTNCYIYTDDMSKEAIVIDPGDDFDLIVKYVDESKIDVRYIILTHGHFDHIMDVAKLKQELDLKNNIGVEIMISEGDEDFVTDRRKNMSPVNYKLDIFRADKILKEGETINLGFTQFRVIETPGHTPGGVCLYTDGMVFSGDTLFYQSVGRTDLYGGSDSAIWRSVKDKLFKLPDDTIVYPGHGVQTTIGNEKQYWRE